MRTETMSLTNTVVGPTRIVDIDPDLHRLSYRGHDVQVLCARNSFEEVAHLLTRGHLPTPAELADFERRERASRAVGFDCGELLRFVKGTHPTDQLRFLVSYEGCRATNERLTAFDEKSRERVELIFKIPTLIAAIFRNEQGLPILSPDPALDATTDFFRMCFGTLPTAAQHEALRVTRILYSEHGFNAATYAGRVCTSTVTDFSGTIATCISTLKGIIHGGAVEFIVPMLEEIGNPANARAWLQRKFAAKEKVMGFGHRLYKKGPDPRYHPMMAALKMIEAADARVPYARIIEALMETMATEKKIFPNVDLASGPIFKLLGFPTEHFLNLIILSRSYGWYAHTLEQIELNKLIRPQSVYQPNL